MAKTRLGIAALAALMMGDFGMPMGRGIVHTWKIDGKPKTPPKPNGLKKFIIDGVEVWAINEKNAIRKASKLNQATS